MASPAKAIREFAPANRDALVGLMIELQTFEARFAPGRTPADEAFGVWYIDRLLDLLHERDGVLLVAVLEGASCGFCAGYAEEEPEAREHYFYIAELVVSERHRGRGIGTRLIAEMEDLARSLGLKTTGIGVLAGSERVHRLYHRLGYRDYAIKLRKRLGGTHGSQGG